MSQKQLLGMLIACVLIVVVDATYASSQESWGSGEAAFYYGVFLIALLVGLVSLVLLIANARKARRHATDPR